MRSKGLLRFELFKLTFKFSCGVILFSLILVLGMTPVFSDTAISISTDGVLSEKTLDGRVINLTLNAMTFTDEMLDKNSFELIDAPAGLSINQVDYIDATHCSLTLSYDGTGFVGNRYLQIKVPGTELTSGADVKVNTPTVYSSEDIDAAHNRTMILKNNGTLWGRGVNNIGQLGDGTAISRSTAVQVRGSEDNGSFADIAAIATGQTHTIALKSDGTVWGWGNNSNGKLGDGTTNTIRYTPVQVKEPGNSGYLTDVVAIASGYEHTVAVKKDGTVWTWGNNFYGQLGDNTTTYSNIPVQVKGPGNNGYLTDVVAVTAGQYHTLALKSDGTVWGWGSNYDGSTLLAIDIGHSYTPIQLVGTWGSGYLSDIVAIDADKNHAVALKSDGTVWTWGNNTYGQLGDNTTNPRYSPVQVLSYYGNVCLTEITAIEAGQYYTVALKRDGTVWTWGRNDYGQLGSNTAGINMLTAAKVWDSQNNTHLGNIAAISAGENHTVALKSDGRILAWGAGYSSQYGVQADIQFTDTSARIIAEGVLLHEASLDGKQITFALVNDIFKDNTLDKTNFVINNAPAGLEIDSISYIEPTKCSIILSCDATDFIGDKGITITVDGVELSRGATAESNKTFIYSSERLAAGGNHTSALLDGTLWTWGLNDSGQLGDYSTVSQSIPTKVVNSGTRGYLTDVLFVEASNSHTVVVKIDGTVWAWGKNDYGQLGNSSTTNSYAPVQAKGPGGSGYITDVVAVAAGDGYTIALKSDGTVWAWGKNDFGQLGDSSATNSNVPVQVKGPGGSGYLSRIMAITAGSNHIIALKNDGTVWTWGKNDYGQLGDHSTTNKNLPVQVKLSDEYLRDVIAVAGGSDFSVALKDDGTVWTWGQNDYGTLGNGDWHDTSGAVQVKGRDRVGYLTDIIAIAAGDTHVTALNGDGRLLTWGSNTYGQLGANDYTGIHDTPIFVDGESGYFDLEDVAGTAVGGKHTIALKNNGAVLTWGYNGYGQLGSNSTTNRNFPQKINFFGPHIEVEGRLSESDLDGKVLLLELKTDCFSDEVLDRANFALKNAPQGLSITDVSYIDSKHCSLTLSYNGGRLTRGKHFSIIIMGAETVKETNMDSTIIYIQPLNVIVAGYSHTVAIKSDGTVWAWGYNHKGQLGNNSTAESHTPIQIIGPDGVGYLEDIIDIAAGTGHTIALKADGTVWTWGENFNGQLGNNSTIESHIPVQVNGPDGIGYLSDIVAVAAGYQYSLALRSDGTVWAWGNNSNGELGDNTSTKRSTPVQVRGVKGGGYLTEIIAIEAGKNHTVALKSDGTVLAWGNNAYGQLGDATTTTRYAPVYAVKYISGGYYPFNGAIAVAAGYSNSAAIKPDGTAWTWGDNTYGQLGLRTNKSWSAPEQVVNGLGDIGFGYMKDAIEITVGYQHIVILKRDKTVWTSGRNNHGQMGDGSYIDKNAPVQVVGVGNTGYLSNIVGIAGEQHTIAFKENGITLAWGNNEYGKLGDNTVVNKNAPVIVESFIGGGDKEPIVSNSGVNGSEDTAIPFTVSSFTSCYSDWDGDSLAKIKIITLPANGALKLNGLDIAAEQEITAANLAGITFVPQANWNGTTAFSWKASDGIAYSIDEATLSINISAASDLPIVSNSIKNGSEDETVLFLSDDFISSFNDPDGDIFSKLQFVTLPADGLLKLNGTDVSESQEVLLAELGNLAYTPEADWNGITTLTWKAHDGTAYSANTAILSINISPVNDIPSVSDSLKNGAEDTVMYFTSDDFTAYFNDVDDDALDKIQVVSLPSIGRLSLNGADISEGQEIVSEDLRSMTYEPEADWYGNTSLVWKGHDGTSYASNEATLNINIAVQPIEISSLTASPRSPEPANRPITFTTAATGGTQLLYKYSLHNGTAWTDLTDYDESNQYVWTPVTPGSYKIGIYVKDVESGDYKFKEITYTITEAVLPIEINSLKAYPSGPRPANSDITLKAEVAGGTELRYRFEAFDGMEYTELGGYTADNTCVWTPEKAGEYALHVYVKEAESTEAYNAHGETTYVVAEPIEITSFRAYNESPQPVNMEITLRARAEGGTSLKYRFGVDDGTAHTYLNSYTTDNTCDWTPKEAGEYTVYVYIRDRNSAEDYDAYEEISYTVTEAPDGVVINSLRADSEGPLPVGADIELTAKASGGTNLQYMFRVFDGKRYTNLSSYSSDDTCIWTPEKPGTYRIFVYVKEEDSEADYDAEKKIVIEIE